MQEYNYKRLRDAITGAIFVAALLASPYARAEDAPVNSNAVVFVYQRIGEDGVPQGNISIDQFREHITELRKGGYAVLPLPKIIEAVKAGKALPPKTVGITFEGAYQATLTNALPLLEEANMPFTLFFATDLIDSANSSSASWDQLKKLYKNKLTTLGIMSADYVHMVSQTPEQNAALINRAVSRYREMFSEDPVFFSYPYGEYSNTLKKQLEGYHFSAIFGQHSGVLHPLSDLMALPRFTMTNEYGDLDRFILTANALPLPVSDLVPDDSLMMTQNPPIIGFTIAPDITNLGKLSCFASNIGKLPLMRIGGNRIEIRPELPFTDRRTRINCTLPNRLSPGLAGSWRWFGMLLINTGIEEDTGTEAPENNESPENQ